jgi:hypothetical protein
MPGAGASARPARRYAAPWWEELDREAFRFPAAREVSARHAARAAAASPRPAPRPAAPEPRPVRAPSAAPGAAASPDGIRRTVTIRGYGAERDLPVARSEVRRHERPGFRPDYAALWAVLLGLCLILVAVASAHG